MSRLCRSGGLPALGLVLLGILGGQVTAGPATSPERAEASVIEVTLEVSADQSPVGAAEVQVRVFEADDPDAPPQVSNVAADTIAIETLTFPATVKLMAPAGRLAGVLRPAVGVIVVSEGRMVLWNEAIAPLNPSGPTTVRLVPVP